MMTEHHNHTDRHWHETLQRLGAQTPAPPAPDARRIQGWLKAAPLRRRRRRLVLTVASAAAAVLVVGLLMTFHQTVQPVSADEIFARLSSSFQQTPVVRIEVRDMVVDGYKLQMSLAVDQSTRQMYGQLDLSTTDSADGPPVEMKLTAASQNEQGWALVEKLRVNGSPPLAGIVPPDGALLVKGQGPSPVHDRAPVTARLQDTRALLESLQGAVSSLSVQTHETTGLSVLRGVITDPHQIDTALLGRAFRIDLDEQFISPPLLRPPGEDEIRHAAQVARMMTLSLDDPDQQQAAAERIDRFARRALERLKRHRQVDEPARRAKLRAAMTRLLAGAELTIIYDARHGQLRSIELGKLGLSDGAITIAFDKHFVSQDRLDASRFDGRNDVRTLTRNQLLGELIVNHLMNRNDSVPIGNTP
jgi:hypothetical protein